MRRTVTWLVALAASVGFGLLAVRDVDVDVFWRGLTENDYGWMVPAVGLVAVAVYLRALRWALLFRPETRPHLPPITRALLIGYLFNQILPARAGEAARVVALHREAGTSRAESVGTAVVERLYDVGALLALLFLALPFFPPVTWVLAASYFAAAFVVGTGLVIVVTKVFHDRPFRFVLRPLARLPWVSHERVERAAYNLNEGMVALRHPRTALLVALLTLASWLAAAAAFWLIIVGFDFGIGFSGGLLVVIATNLALVIPSLPAGVGVFEAATIISLDAFGVGASEALSCAVVIHALNFFPFVFAGLVALHLHLRLMRRRAQHAERKGQASPT